MYTLLIIEDEELVRKGISSLIDFDKMGIGSVYEAENGEVAWDIIVEQRPDIILSDINMPHMDGITLAKKVKELDKDTHIVFLTGYDYFDYAVSALKLGADDYVLKPISKKDVENILINITNKLNQERREKAVYELISENEQNPCGSSGSDELLCIINQKIYCSDFSLKDLANQMGFSTNYLSTFIKKHLGMSFQDYLTKNRIDRAKILLLTTDLKIYEIAEQVGYEDVNYFSSRFKQYVGMTPRQYQKGVQ
ncbi:MAG: response regulator [Peptostreptococcus porci]|nr:response regulator [Peptostreptococcus porci]